MYVKTHNTGIYQFHHQNQNDPITQSLNRQFVMLKFKKDNLFTK